MKISTTDKVIKAGSLITNMDNVFVITGFIIVRGYRPEDGKHHNDYCMTLNHCPDIDDIIKCLDSGAKASDVGILIKKMELVH